ncbi:MAG: lactate utilization protein [Limnochordia bacterium]|jgi:L-lactate utilization protein LutB
MDLTPLTKEVDERYRQVRGEQTVKALEKRGFPACYVATKAEAVAKVLEVIPPGASIGVGGSVTIRELGLIDELTGRGHRVIHHWQSGLSAKEIDGLRKEAMFADIYLTSSNAITVDGQLVNTDGVGNRVAAMIYGPGTVVVIAGVNKIVGDVEGAFERIQHQAAPKNGIRLETKTPCTILGYCNDCDSAARMCKAKVVLERKPTATDYQVIIVGEDLGY